MGRDRRVPVKSTTACRRGGGTRSENSQCGGASTDVKKACRKGSAGESVDASSRWRPQHPRAMSRVQRVGLAAL